MYVYLRSHSKFAFWPKTSPGIYNLACDIDSIDASARRSKSIHEPQEQIMNYWRSRIEILPCNSMRSVDWWLPTTPQYNFTRRVWTKMRVHELLVNLSLILTGTEYKDDASGVVYTRHNAHLPWSWTRTRGVVKDGRAQVGDRTRNGQAISWPLWLTHRKSSACLI